VSSNLGRIIVSFALLFNVSIYIDIWIVGFLNSLSIEIPDFISRNLAGAPKTANLRADRVLGATQDSRFSGLDKARLEGQPGWLKLARSKACLLNHR
jgi:hypothetical protein